MCGARALLLMCKSFNKFQEKRNVTFDRRLHKSAINVERTKKALDHYTKREKKETSNHNLNRWAQTTREKFHSINQAHETKAAEQKKSIMLGGLEMCWMNRKPWRIQSLIRLQFVWVPLNEMLKKKRIFWSLKEFLLFAWRFNFNSKWFNKSLMV